MRFDVWSEGSAVVAAALKNGAELLNPKTGKDQARRPVVSWVDAAYVEAQARHLRDLGRRLRGVPFVGVCYGRDEPTVAPPIWRFLLPAP